MGAPPVTGKPASTRRGLLPSPRSSPRDATTARTCSQRPQIVTELRATTYTSHSGSTPPQRSWQRTQATTDPRPRTRTSAHGTTRGAAQTDPQHAHQREQHLPTGKQPNWPAHLPHGKQPATASEQHEHDNARRRDNTASSHDNPARRTTRTLGQCQTTQLSGIDSGASRSLRNRAQPPYEPVLQVPLGSLGCTTERLGTAVYYSPGGCVASPVLQVRVSEETLARIDAARGEATRSDWARDTIVRALDGEPAPVSFSESAAADVRPAAEARPRRAVPKPATEAPSSFAAADFPAPRMPRSRGGE